MLRMRGLKRFVYILGLSKFQESSIDEKGNNRNDFRPCLVHVFENRS